MNLNEWARRHSISQAALNELTQLLAVDPAPSAPAVARSEGAAQQEVRFSGSKYGGCLWRNNVGQLKTDDGVPVRFGLANDSKRINERVKSSDLIGYLPFIIAPEHVGTTIGVFMAIECKHGAWKWHGTDRELAQQRYHKLVQLGGGCAGFARNAEDLSEIVLNFEAGLRIGS